MALRGHPFTKRKANAMFPQYDEDSQKRAQALFSTMQGVEFPEEEPVAAPVRERGPFSALFPYDEEVEESFAKREQANQKIARGNAITDGFNLLISGLGGAAGATIPKKELNQSIFKALDDYRALDSEKRSRLDRFRLLDLNNRSRDLQYSQGLEAEERGREFSREIKKEDRDFSSGQKEIDRDFTAGQKQEDRTFRAEESEKERQFTTGQEEVKGQRAVDAISAKAEETRKTNLQQKDLGHYSYQERSARNKAAYSVKGVPITPDLETKMIRALQEMYEGDPNKPFVLSSVDWNEPVKDESIRDLILQNWDQLIKLIPELTGSSSRESLVATPTAKNQQENTSEAYANGIANVMANTEYSYRKKLRLIRDAAMNEYNWDKAKAENYAKELLR